VERKGRITCLILFLKYLVSRFVLILNPRKDGDLKKKSPEVSPSRDHSLDGLSLPLFWGSPLAP
jgi:hypothetical protein